jgi:NAD(P)-dependent dehydrogenase (short-subunit alcohol dehydrogenase family)
VDLMLRDKVAIVTGASKGIGMAVTEALADEGALVVAAARRVSSLQGLENVTAIAVDLSDPVAPTTLVQQALDAYGRIDILINNVGGLEVRSAGFLATTDEDFRWSMEMNLFTTLRASRAVLKSMAEQCSGSIVNIGSTDFSVEPDGSTIDYGVAKAAVVNLTRTLALEFGIRGIRVNAVSPGPVSTDLWLGESGIIETVAALGGVEASVLRDSIIARMGGIATGRFTSPEEVAALVVFLASPRAASITGADYLIGR